MSDVPLKDTSNPVIFAYYLNGDHRLLNEQEAIIAVKDETAAWIHILASHANSVDWLHKNLAFLDPIIAEALSAKETRPRCESIGDGFLLILRGMNLENKPDDMVSIRIWADSLRVITLEKRPTTAIHLVSQEYIHGKKPMSTSAVMTKLLSTLLDVMQPVFVEMDASVDDLEEKIVDDPSFSLRQDINMLRKRAIHIRRYISPQREAIAKLRSFSRRWVREKDQLEIQECYDTVLRYIEHFDSIRERTQLIEDELTMLLANRLNQNTYVLSVFAAIFLPLTFITGLLGVNVGGIPGFDDPNAFRFVLIICLSVIALEVFIFKKLNWF